MNNITDNIPGLKIEANDDGTYTLEQEWTGNVDRVAVHAVHVRHLAERLGLIVQSHTECAIGKSSAELKRDNDRLKRNMLRVHEHALNFQNDFRENADWKHADLTHEMGVINTLVDLLDMAVDDFRDDYTAHEPTRSPLVTQAKPNGLPEASEAPPKTGALADPAAPHHVTPADPSPKPSGKASPQLEIEA